jgi:prepilin-type N-terminal cleavage/methylation domain-containing protein
MTGTHCRRSAQAGFSLIEMMVVLLLLSIVAGAVFTQINQVQVRSSAEQVKLDAFQESREFMDQLVRDLHQAGYPSVRLYAAGVLSSPENNDSKNAIGLVKVAVDEIRFEGDIDGDGTVESMRYHLDSNGNNCPCMKRSEVGKVTGDPLTAPTASYETEVQNVQNGTTAAPLFRAFRVDGTEVTLPVDISSNANDIASIYTIQVRLTVRPQTPDFQNRQRPEANLGATVRLNNCSAAVSGQPMSCM